MFILIFIFTTLERKHSSYLIVFYQPVLGKEKEVPECPLNFHFLFGEKILKNDHKDPIFHQF